MEIAKVMVFKTLPELPGCFKYIKEYIPSDREKVVVTGQDTIGQEIYLSIRFSQGRKGRLNARHFRSIQADKLRDRLLQVKVRDEKMETLLKTL